MNDAIHDDPGARIGLIRLGIGVTQGLVAWWLIQAVTDKAAWPAAHPLTFAALVLITAWVPLIVLAEIGRMPARVLAIWCAVATVSLVLLAGYDLWREPLELGKPRFWPSADLIISTAPALFIANQLIAHRTGQMRLFGAYSAYFESSWMRVFQLMLSLAFTGVFWGVLQLGRALFDLIHLPWFGHFIDKDYIRSPLLAGAFAMAVHLTDVRPALLRGTRNLGLTLLSWQAPVAVALCAAFLAALPFTGLQPLWSTRFAASLLLWAASVMLILINAAYNDGTDAHRPMLPLRIAVRAAGPVMLLLALLAADGAAGHAIWLDPAARARRRRGGDRAGLWRGLWRGRAAIGAVDAAARTREHRHQLCHAGSTGRAGLAAGRSGAAQRRQPGCPAA